MIYLVAATVTVAVLAVAGLYWERILARITEEVREYETATRDGLVQRWIILPKRAVVWRVRLPGWRYQSDVCSCDSRMAWHRPMLYHSRESGFELWWEPIPNVHNFKNMHKAG